MLRVMNYLHLGPQLQLNHPSREVRKEKGKEVRRLNQGNNRRKSRTKRAKRRQIDLTLDYLDF